MTSRRLAYVTFSPVLMFRKVLSHHNFRLYIFAIVPFSFSQTYPTAKLFPSRHFPNRTIFWVRKTKIKCCAVKLQICETSLLPNDSNTVRQKITSQEPETCIQKNQRKPYLNMFTDLIIMRHISAHM